MGYPDFLKGLFADGRVIVPEIAKLADDELRAGDAVIVEFELLNRLEMPGEAPPFVDAAGRWAGTSLLRACQFLVYRDADEQAITEALRDVPYGQPMSPSVHYSVDLVFRFLPDVAKFARSAAEDDPLVARLHDWARQWPLSSVGMSGIDDVDIRGFASDLSLMRLYADRIIATKDKARLADLNARQAVRSALGMFPDLADNISDALLQYDQPQRDAQDDAR